MDQRVLHRTPAERIVVAVHLFLEEHLTGAEVADDVPVRLLAEPPREVGHFVWEGAVRLQELKEAHALFLANPEIVLAERWREMNEARAAVERHEIRIDDLPGRAALGLRVAERRLVAQPDELGALARRHDLHVVA